MNPFREFIKLLTMTLFITAGAMSYAFVFDVEPIPAEKQYAMERDVYNRSTDAGYFDFQSFNAWLVEQDRKQDRFHDWVAGLKYEVGVGAALSFDPWYHERQDTREGHSAAAPDNWAIGRD